MFKDLRVLIINLLAIAAISLIFIFFLNKYITKRSIKSMEEKLNRQREFFGEVSHGLKTPLTIAITNLALIKSHQDEPVRAQEKWLGYIEYQLERLSRIINEISFLEQVDFLEQYNKETINLSSLLNWYINNLQAVIKEKSISIDKNIEENVYINMDTEHITKLISILTDNAIKYTPENGLITITLEQGKKNILMSIENTGEGIEPKYIDRIFDRFYRINKPGNRDIGGTGLGLAIAKSILEKMDGGKISVESTVGEKTSFYVTLPKSER